MNREVFMLSSKNVLFHLKRNIILIVTFLLMSALLINTIYVSAIESNFSNHYPSNGSTIRTSSTTISTFVRSTNGANLYDFTAKATINGMSVTPQFQYTGRWIMEYEGDGGEYFYVDSYKEGTFTLNANKLKDGWNDVEVSINDANGTTLRESWRFYVAEQPKFSNLSPTDKQKSVTQLSGYIQDNSSVNWTSVKLKINNIYVDSTKLIIDESNGKVTYDTTNLPDGNYWATLEASDNLGNLGTKSWDFVVDSSPPEITYILDFKEGMDIIDGKLKFSASIKDQVDIKNNVTLSLNGTPLPIDFKYEGDINKYSNSPKTTAYIDYEGIVPNGSHNLSLSSEDELGNSMTKTWRFTVSAKPTISNESPILYGVSNLKPTISAVIKSSNNIVKREAIVLKVNGDVVDFTYNQVTGQLTYTPTNPLINERYQTVNIAINGPNGVLETREWKFYTNTFKDMNDSNISSCNSCHQLKSNYGNNDFEKMHSNKLSFTGNHLNNNCENCHNYISYQAGCSQCHGSDETGIEYAPHGSSPLIYYQTKNTNQYFPIRVKDNREMYDCIICHQPGTGVKDGAGTLLNNHDIPELHKAPADENCTSCHAQSLTREHAQNGRTDLNNNTITCNTCHQSTSPKVVQAITNKDTSCSACHDDLSHSVLHETELNENCVGCHDNSLSTEHQQREVMCIACHNSSDIKVQDAIKNKNKSCQACHITIHEAQHTDCKTCHYKNDSTLVSHYAPID